MTELIKNIIKNNFLYWTVIEIDSEDSWDGRRQGILKQSLDVLQKVTCREVRWWKGNFRQTFRSRGTDIFLLFFHYCYRDFRTASFKEGAQCFEMKIIAKWKFVFTQFIFLNVFFFQWFSKCGSHEKVPFRSPCSRKSITKIS